MPLRIALLQSAGTIGDVDANLRELRAAADAAAAQDASLLVTPEMFLTGYNVAERLATLANRDLLADVQQVAREAGVALIVGAPEAATGGIYNAAFCVDDHGTLLTVYRKAHLFGELDRAMFRPGDQPFGSFVLDDVTVAVIICYDVEFPETVRAAADQGAHLIAVPTAQMEPFAFVADNVVRTRAWENQVYVAYANRVGREGDLVYVGRSSVVAPDGSILVRAESHTRLLVAGIDPGVVQEQQSANPYLSDRRPALYGRLPGLPPETQHPRQGS